MAQAAEHLTSKCVALSSIPKTNKQMKFRNQVNKYKEMEEILQNLILEIQEP
jgi:hypothetical protein